ncbi:tetratricopeptide repeat protein [Bacillus thuringiensis]|uniref:tetratricopeptide repeat protein n=1 Tax=Bacillus thuringiensis TaxID=1428 RepID=UPI000BF6D262|nr:hypothetical protein [Bacillus thuringiensis]PEQ66176.1 hypothetical protein CN474_26915 [Bacillus thuringiensis]
MEQELKCVEGDFNVVLSNTIHAEIEQLNYVISEIINVNRMNKIRILNYKYKEEELTNVLNIIFDKNKFLQSVIDNITICVPESKDMHKVLMGKKEFCDDYLIILGVERLCNLTNEKPFVEKLTDETSIRLFTPEQLNIDEKVYELKKFFDDENSYFRKYILFFETSHKKAELITNEFADNEQIYTSVLLDQSTQIINIDEISKFIVSNDLNESLRYIKEECITLSQTNQSLLKIISYFHNGYLEEALKELFEVYKDLSDEQIIFCANMLIAKKRYSEAYGILFEIYKQDKWVPGLLEGLGKSSINFEMNDRRELLEELLKIDGNNLFILQELSNLLYKNENYSESGKFYRKIFSISKNRYFDMLASISEIISEKPESVNVAESYLLRLCNGDDLDNEIYYRTALICKKIYNSDYKYYSNLIKIKINEDFYRSREVVTRKLEILKNEDSIRNIIKLKADKDRDLVRIRNLRINGIIEGLEYLFLEDQGYQYLQEFSDSTQNNDVWFSSVNETLMKEIELWNSTSIEGVQESVIRSDLTKYKEDGNVEFEDLLYVVRNLKIKTDLSKIEKMDIIKGVLISQSRFNDPIKEAYLRHEISMYLSYIGDFQQANEHALTILNKYNRENNKLVKKTLLGLGLSAWATSQYKIGRKIDGILCAIVAIRQGIEIKNFYILEGAINIIFLYINNDLKEGKKTRSLFVSFKEKFTSSIAGENHEEVLEIEKLLSLGHWEKVSQILGGILKDNVLNDVKDATNMANYINALLKINEEEKAYRLIKDNSNQIINLFQHRLDHRWKLCYQFAQVIFGYYLKEGENREQELNFISSLLDTATADIEVQRSKIFHMQERAAFSETTKEVYKFFLDILLLKQKSEGISGQNRMELDSKIIDIVFLLSPRAVVEKRFSNKKISQQANQKANEYFQLYDEMLKLKPDVDAEEYIKKSHRCEELKSYLIQEHPSFRSMFLLEKINLSILQENLQENVFYQYCLTTYGVVSLLVTKNSYQIDYNVFDTNSFNSKLKILGDELSTSKDSKEEKLREVEKECIECSKILFNNLINYIRKTEGLLDLVICPDMSIPYFTTSLMRDEIGWVIEKIKKINHVISPGEFKYRGITEIEYTKNNIISIGSKINEKDTAIPMAQKWMRLNHKKFSSYIEDFGHDYEALYKLLFETKPALFVFIAHGIEESGEKKIASGAVRILGTNKIYLGSEFLEGISSKVQTLFLLTCQSGQPTVNNIQSEDSIWRSVVSQNCNSILCRWDVGVEPGLIVIGELINENREEDMSVLLIEAQKKLLRGKLYNIPSDWACFEFWGLE